MNTVQMRYFAIDQRKTQIEQTTLAVNEFLYRKVIQPPPSGIVLPRWIAMINHVLRNGVPT